MRGGLPSPRAPGKGSDVSTNREQRKGSLKQEQAEDLGRLERALADALLPSGAQQ